MRSADARTPHGQSAHDYDSFSEEQNRIEKKHLRSAKIGWKWEKRPEMVSTQMDGPYRSIALALENRVSAVEVEMSTRSDSMTALVEGRRIPDCPDADTMMAYFDEASGQDSPNPETSGRISHQTSRDIRRLERKFRAHVSSDLADSSKRGKLKAHFRAHALAMEAGFVLDYEKAIDLAGRYPNGGLSLLVDAEGVPSKRSRQYVISVHAKLRSLDPLYSRRREMATLVSKVDAIGTMDSLAELWTDSGDEFQVYSAKSTKGAEMQEMVSRHMRERADGLVSSISPDDEFRLLDFMQIKAAQFLDGGVETSDSVISAEIGSDQQLVSYVEERYYGILRATHNVRSAAPLLDHLVKLQASLRTSVGISKRCVQSIRGNTNGSRDALHAFADRNERQHDGNHQAAFTWSIANLDRIPLDPQKRYTTRKVYQNGILAYDELLWKANGRNKLTFDGRSMSFDHELRIVLHALIEYGDMATASEVTGIPLMKVKRKMVSLLRFAEAVNGEIVPESQWPEWDIPLPPQIRHLIAHKALRYTGRIFLLGENMFPLMEPVREAFDQLTERIELEREAFHEPEDITVIEKRYAYRRRAVENVWRAVWFRHLAFQRYYRDQWRYKNWVSRKSRRSLDWNRRDRVKENLVIERNLFQMGLILTIQRYVRTTGDPDAIGKAYGEQYGKSGWIRVHMAYKRYMCLIPALAHIITYDSPLFPKILEMATSHIRGPPNDSTPKFRNIFRIVPMPLAS